MSGLRSLRSCAGADHVAVRSLLARVAKLEQARSPASPIELWFGSLEAFSNDLRAGIRAGEYDPTDMPEVIAGIERWHREGAWAR
jgi:hypothetical protein